MSMKEILQKMLMSYFVLVTCILVAIMIMGEIFDPEAQLTYRSLQSPLIFGFLGILPTVIMYAPKELSDRQIIIRKVLQLLVIEAEILLYTLTNPTIDTSEPQKIIGIMISVLLVFVVTNLLNLLNSYINAQKLNKYLLELQKSNQ